MKAHSTLTFFAISTLAFSDDPLETDSSSNMPIVELPQYVKTATRFANSKEDLPYTINYLGLDELQYKSPRNFADLLGDTPGIMVQRTGYGQSSPYIRGFTGFHTLLLVDGIRINNSIFRSGPNQYWGTVGTTGIRGIDILKGPASVQYGSDAIGGAVQLISANALDAPPSNRISLRHASAEDSFGGTLQLSRVLAESSAISLGFSYRNYGDLKGGSSVSTQPYTEYDENDANLTFSQKLKNGLFTTVSHQRYSQTNVPRTHSTIHGIDWKDLSSGSDLRREFDQERSLSYLKIGNASDRASDLSWNATLSWQQQSEDEDRIRKSGKRRLRGFDLTTLGINFDLRKEFENGALIVGSEHYHDSVDTYSTNFAPNGDVASEDIQGPVADDSYYDLSSAFALAQYSFSPNWSTHLGVRYTHASADAGRYEEPSTGTPASLEESWDNLVGSARLLWKSPGEVPLTAFVGISQAFRAPNLSDLTRLDIARSGELEIPSSNLDAEEFTNYEIGIRQEQKHLSIEGSLFYTDIENQIVRTPTGNSISIGDERFETVTKLNSGHGYIKGTELSLTYRPSDRWSVFAQLTRMRGRIHTFSALETSLVPVEEPISRIMPDTLVSGLRFKTLDARIFVESRIRATSAQEELSSNDQRDTQRIPPGGTPGYSVLDIFSSFRISQSITLNVTLENVFNKDYRIHGSGHNMPGRNFVSNFSYHF